MKSFSFRLDRILKLREDAEQAQARRFGEAARVEADLDRQAKERARDVSRIADQINPASGARTTAGLLRALHLTSSAAASQLESVEQARAEAESKAEVERAELAKARVERKTLERLKEQQQTTWRETLGRHDQKEMDEIASRHRGPR